MVQDFVWVARARSVALAGRLSMGFRFFRSGIGSRMIDYWFVLAAEQLRIERVPWPFVEVRRRVVPNRGRGSET